MYLCLHESVERSYYNDYRTRLRQGERLEDQTLPRSRSGGNHDIVAPEDFVNGMGLPWVKTVGNSKSFQNTWLQRVKLFR
jgi:hypothetical protein